MRRRVWCLCRCGRVPSRQCPRLLGWCPSRDWPARCASGCPDLLNGVEVGGVGGKPFDHQSSSLLSDEACIARLRWEGSPSSLVVEEDQGSLARAFYFGPALVDTLLDGLVVPLHGLALAVAGSTPSGGAPSERGRGVILHSNGLLVTSATRVSVHRSVGYPSPLHPLEGPFYLDQVGIGHLAGRQGGPVRFSAYFPPTLHSLCKSETVW